jgi:membrane protease YdiL (CAAX protease family)
VSSRLDRDPTRSLPALDARLAGLAVLPGRTWGVRDALLGLLAVPASLLLPGLLLAVVDVPGGVLVVVASLFLCGFTALAVRRPARQSGGVRAALGFDLPRWSDAGTVLRWTVLLFVLQAVVSVLVGLVVPALRGVAADNTSFLVGIPVVELVLVAVAAVVVAPVVEELLFRGLLLQGLMLRIGFWPAAVLSSVLFGVLHMASLDAGGAALAVATGVMGLGLCVLARRTGRLGPGIGVHAVRNALALVLVALA